MYVDKYISLIPLKNMLTNIADPDQTAPREQSDLDLHCLLRPLCLNIKADYYNAFNLV